MITQNIKVNITSGLAPYTYYFQSSNPCLTFGTVTGVTSDNTILNSYSAISGECYDVSEASVTITTADGCVTTIPIDIVNPCRDFAINAIVRVSDYSFSVSSTRNGCGQIELEWDYDDVIFDLKHITNTAYTSVLELEPKPGVVFPDTVNIQVSGVDCNGCTTAVVGSFAICKPFVKSETVYLNCIVNTAGEIEGFISDYIEFNEYSTCSTQINWNSISINYPDGISAYVPQPGEIIRADNFIKFEGENNLTPGVYEATYTVEDVNGLMSNISTIFFVVGDCDNDDQISIANINFAIDCNTAVVGEPVYIPFSGAVNNASDVAIDWTSFTVIDFGNIPETYPPDNNPTISLYTDPVTAERQIQYVLQEPISSNVFVVQVSNVDGGVISSSGIVSVEGCQGFNPEAPIARNNTYCVPCGSTIEVFPITDTDSVAGTDFVANSPDLGSLTLVDDNNLQGVATVDNTTGKVTYVSPAGFTGITQIKYRFADAANGEISNLAIITFEVVCAGEDAQISVCEF